MTLFPKKPEYSRAFYQHLKSNVGFSNRHFKVLYKILTIEVTGHPPLYLYFSDN